MNDKGTIVQQLEDERNHLVAKIQEMQALLERWVEALEECDVVRVDLKEIFDDTKALLKEAKEILNVPLLLVLFLQK